MPPPPVPLTPKSITKTSIQPRPKSYVRGEVTVHKIERVKSERPSPPPTPVRVKSEPVERAPIVSTSYSEDSDELINRLLPVRAL